MKSRRRSDQDLRLEEMIMGVEMMMKTKLKFVHENKLTIKPYYRPKSKCSSKLKKVIYKETTSIWRKMRFRLLFHRLWSKVQYCNFHITPRTILISTPTAVTTNLRQILCRCQRKSLYIVITIHSSRPTGSSTWPKILFRHPLGAEGDIFKACTLEWAPIRKLINEACSHQ